MPQIRPVSDLRNNFADISRTVHEIYTELSLTEADEAHIVARTAGLLSAPVVLEDVRHRVLAHADAHLEDWINRSKFVGYLEHTGRATGAENWLQTPVGAARRRWGRLRGGRVRRAGPRRAALPGS